MTEHGRPITRLRAIGGGIDRRAEVVRAGIIPPAAKPPRRLPSKRVKLASGASQLTETVTEQRR